MPFKFLSAASGSSGNCYILKTEETAVLIDVGTTGKRIIEGLSEMGLSPEDVDGILVTHEHTDHVKSLKMIGKKASSARIYGSSETLHAVRETAPGERLFEVEPGAAFVVGDMKIRAFSLSHDAAGPLGYSVIAGDKMCTVVTDTGCITEEMFGYIRESDLLVLEANHEVNVLMMGSYPYYLKQRIVGDKGHISNETAGSTLCRMLRERRNGNTPKVILAHLSRENNTPEQAFLTVKNMLFEEDFLVGRDLFLDVAKRDQVGHIIEI